MASSDKNAVLECALAKVDGGPSMFWTLAELVALPRVEKDRKIILPDGNTLYFVTTSKPVEVES